MWQLHWLILFTEVAFFNWFYIVIINWFVFLWCTDKWFLCNYIVELNDCWLFFILQFNCNLKAAASWLLCKLVHAATHFIFSWSNFIWSWESLWRVFIFNAIILSKAARKINKCCLAISWIQNGKKYCDVRLLKAAINIVILIFPAVHSCCMIKVKILKNLEAGFWKRRQWLTDHQQFQL